MATLYLIQVTTRLKFGMWSDQMPEETLFQFSFAEANFLDRVIDFTSQVDLIKIAIMTHIF